MPLQYINVNNKGGQYKNIRVEDINTSIILVMSDMNLYKVVKKYRIVIDKTNGKMLGDTTNDIIICRCNKKGEILNNETHIAQFEDD